MAKKNIHRGTLQRLVADYNAGALGGNSYYRKYDSLSGVVQFKMESDIVPASGTFVAAVGLLHSDLDADEAEIEYQTEGPVLLCRKPGGSPQEPLVYVPRVTDGDIQIGYLQGVFGAMVGNISDSVTGGKNHLFTKLDVNKSSEYKQTEYGNFTIALRGVISQGYTFCGSHGGPWQIVGKSLNIQNRRFCILCPSWSGHLSGILSQQYTKLEYTEDTDENDFENGESLAQVSVGNYTYYCHSPLSNFGDTIPAGVKVVISQNIHKCQTDIIGTECYEVAENGES